MRIFSKGGSTILEIKGNTITNKGGRTLLKINGNTITNPGGRPLLKFQGNRINSPGGSTLFQLSGNRILTKGGSTKYAMEDNCNIAEVACILLAMEEINNMGSKGSGKGGCFIATATMGDYDHPVVMQLREFRDQYLLERNWGKKFTRYYYKWGPYPAKIISKSNLLKKVSYVFIVQPLSFVVQKIMNKKE